MAASPHGCLTPDITPSQTTGMARLTGLFSGTGGGVWEPIGISTFNPVILNKLTATLSGVLIRGSHNYKVGGEWRIDAFTNGVGSTAAGVYNFSAAETGLPYTQGQSLSGGNVGLPYASFLLGAVDSASIGNPTAPQGRKRSWALYAQDSWKITRKLSLEYGLRWDFQGFAREIHDRVSMFDPSAGRSRVVSGMSIRGHSTASRGTGKSWHGSSSDGPGGDRLDVVKSYISAMFSPIFCLSSQSLVT